MASPRNSPQDGQGSEWSEEAVLPHELERNAPLPAISVAMSGTQPANPTPARPTRMAVSDGHEPGFWPVRWLEVASTRGLALADQAVVSGTSFLTTVMIARWAPPDELGVYAMAISLTPRDDRVATLRDDRDDVVTPSFSRHSP